MWEYIWNICCVWVCASDSIRSKYRPVWLSAEFSSPGAAIQICSFCSHTVKQTLRPKYYHANVRHDWLAQTQTTGRTRVHAAMSPQFALARLLIRDFELRDAFWARELTFRTAVKLFAELGWRRLARVRQTREADVTHRLHNSPRSVGWLWIYDGAHYGWNWIATQYDAHSLRHTDHFYLTYIIWKISRAENKKIPSGHKRIGKYLFDLEWMQILWFFEFISALDTGFFKTGCIPASFFNKPEVFFF